MARKKNTTFAGASVYDADVDAPTFRRLVEDGIGDTALVFDILTGSNGETNTITHAGGGRGCPLGLPLVNQFMNGNLALSSASAKNVSGGVGDTIIAPYVIFLPPGEDTIVVEVYLALSGRVTTSVLQPHLRVLSCDGLLATQADVGMTLISGYDDGLSLLVASVSGLSSGYHLVFPSVDTESIAAEFLNASTIGWGTIVCVCIHHGLHQATLNGGPLQQGVNGVGVSIPGATEGVVHRNFDTTMFSNEDPICSYLLGGWNRNLNGLDEYQRGWPAGGNATYTHVDEDGAGVADNTNPARPRFEAHTRSIYAAEGEVAFPVFAETFGAWLSAGKFTVGLAEPPTIGMLDWYAPWPITTAAQDIRSMLIPVPNFKTVSSKLKMAVLLGTEARTLGAWSFFGTTSSGTSAAATPVSLGGDNTLWLARITGIPFVGDGDEVVSVRCSRTGVKVGIDEIAVLGACLHFEP